MLEKCSVCNGKGSVFSKQYGIRFTCDVCRGKGSFDIPEDKQLCPECKGKGTIIIPTNHGFGVESDCKTCSRTGFIEKETFK